METATDEAIRLIDQFSEDPEERERIRLYLSEVPIGDEYQVLSAADWEIGARFVEWLSKSDIVAFKELRLNGEST